MHTCVQMKQCGLDEDPFDGLSDDVMERLGKAMGGDSDNAVHLANYPARLFSETKGVEKEDETRFDMEAAKDAIMQSKHRLESWKQKAQQDIEYDARGEIVGTVVTITSAASAEHKQQRYAKGENMPYVKLTRKPTIREVAELNSLAAEQAAAFCMIATTLERHLNNETNIEQLQMQILGKAGAGKSKIIHAVLWYLFQLDGLHLVQITSFTWKAASLLNSEVIQGNSICTLFGLNPFNPQTAPGTSTKSEVLMNDKVVMILNDEVFLNNCAHLKVRILQFDDDGLCNVRY
jgi:hypothetical protein